MRLLVTIPHFCARGPARTGFYGSESDPLERRAEAVSRCIEQLHQTFGPQQSLSGHAVHPANTTYRAHLEVVVVTSHDDHLVERLPRHLFFHQPTRVDPRALGFVCHTLMREQVDRFDWFAFMEDDIGVADALLFEKLAWFGAQFGAEALLQPNRFEVSRDLAIHKLYVDGDLNLPGVAAQFQDIAVRRYIEAPAFGRAVRFQRVENVHSGCFFVSASQVRRLMDDPGFGVANDAFVGPLESAATLPIMRAFATYKPARENASFLEVQHLAGRFLQPIRPDGAGMEPAVPADAGLEPSPLAGAESEPSPPAGAELEPSPPAGAGL